jgi:hypothetical protein
MQADIWKQDDIGLFASVGQRSAQIVRIDGTSRFRFTIFGASGQIATGTRKDISAAKSDAAWFFDPKRNH